MRRGETSPTGFTRFELSGRFNRIIEIDPGWFWLVGERNECLCPTLKELDEESLEATLTFDKKEEPTVAGRQFAYLSPRWQAFHVWMVNDPDWGWERKLLEGTDALDQDYEAREPSIVDGREVRVWTKREPVGRPVNSSRHYPALNQTLPTSPDPRVVPGGWGHEHCTLCRGHINAGEFGYGDPQGNWLCETCHQRYVVARDLAFVDEL
jgi:hypothetical protein